MKHLQTLQLKLQTTASEIRTLKNNIKAHQRKYGNAPDAFTRELLKLTTYFINHHIAYTILKKNAGQFEYDYTWTMKQAISTGAISHDKENMLPPLNYTKIKDIIKFESEADKACDPILITRNRLKELHEDNRQFKMHSKLQAKDKSHKDKVSLKKFDPQFKMNHSQSDVRSLNIAHTIFKRTNGNIQLDRKWIQEKITEYKIETLPLIENKDRYVPYDFIASHLERMASMQEPTSSEGTYIAYTIFDRSGGKVMFTKEWIGEKIREYRIGTTPYNSDIPIDAPFESIASHLKNMAQQAKKEEA